MKLDDFSGTEGGVARIRGEVKGFDSVVGKKDLGPSRTMAPLEKEMLETLEIPAEEDMTLEYWKNLIASVENGQIPYVKIDEIIRQMRLVQAAFESAEKNQVVECEI